MVKLEVENTYYEPVTETETVHLCDACGEPCEENNGHYPVTVHEGWDETYDLCGDCVRTLDETNQSLQMSHSGETGRRSATGISKQPIVEWTRPALEWTRSSKWRFIGVFLVLWFGSGLLGLVAEPLGGLVALVLLGWVTYEGYRVIKDRDYSDQMATVEENLSRVVAELDSQLLGSVSLTNDVNTNSRQIDLQREGARDVPFEWYGDTDVDVDVVLDHLDIDLDQQTRERIKASVEKHRKRGDAVDAADIRWIAEASEKLDLEGDHP